MDEPEAGHRTGVQAVERAFALVEVLARHDRPLGVTELAGASRLSVATIHRLLRTLVGLGYVRQDTSRTYALGPGLIRLGERASTGLATWSGPLLEQVVATLDESVNLAVLQRDQVVYLAHVASSQSVRMFTEVGSRVPAHSTGVGKAMLARLDESEARELLARTAMPASTASTLTDPEALLVELREVRRRGYALDEGEHEPGVRCVAVPVAGAVPPLAVSMSGPSPRITEELVARAVPLLQDLAAAIARETGPHQKERAS